MDLFRLQPLHLVFTLGQHREQLRRGLPLRSPGGAERLFHQRSLHSVQAARLTIPNAKHLAPPSK